MPPARSRAEASTAVGAILIVDPDDTSTIPLTADLRGRGHHVETRADAAAALTALAAEDFDVVLLDAALGDQAAALREIRLQHPSLAIVCATDRPTVHEAVELMRIGAFGYVCKPLKTQELNLLLGRLGGHRRHRKHNEPISALLTSNDAAMSAAVAMARQAAEADVPILLIGESGTGKRTLAHAIHQWSGRRARPFVTVWCTALAEQRVERRLLGHVRGAFTISPALPQPGEPAVDGGTIFFDDVGNGNLSQSLQVKLLRLLEEQALGSGGGDPDVDVRVIAASDHDLAADAQAGRLRQDLFFRLNVVTVRLPPLRARLGDLPALRNHILTSLAARHRRSPMRLTASAEDLMARHPWSGNIRELITVLQSAVVMAPGELIDDANLANCLRMASAQTTPAAAVASLEEMELRHIRLVLQQSSTFEEAAARLHINPATLWRKRKRYQLDSPRAAQRVSR